MRSADPVEGLVVVVELAEKKPAVASHLGERPGAFALRSGHALEQPLIVHRHAERRQPRAQAGRQRT